jgi:glycosyltransferase involved in cell wall biosynthesis
MDISLVIPLFNEEESIPELIEWINKVMNLHDHEYEIILIDDGSTDDSWSIIENLSRQQINIIGIKFRRNYGKSAALFSGFDAASGKVVITMDADMQDSPEEIPELYSMVIGGKYDLVSGWKKERHDPLSKTIPMAKCTDIFHCWQNGRDLIK